MGRAGRSGIAFLTGHSKKTGGPGGEGSRAGRREIRALCGHRAGRRSERQVGIDKPGVDVRAGQVPSPGRGGNVESDTHRGDPAIANEECGIGQGHSGTHMGQNARQRMFTPRFGSKSGGRQFGRCGRPDRGTDYQSQSHPPHHWAYNSDAHGRKASALSLKCHGQFGGRTAPGFDGAESPHVPTSPDCFLPSGVFFYES